MKLHKICISLILARKMRTFTKIRDLLVRRINPNFSLKFMMLPINEWSILYLVNGKSYREK